MGPIRNANLPRTCLCIDTLYINNHADSSAVYTVPWYCRVPFLVKEPNALFYGIFAIPIYSRVIINPLVTALSQNCYR